jgi:hypothetical protein
MSSGAMIYVPSFIKIGSDIQKLTGGGDIQTHTYRQQRDLLSLLYFFQNEEIRLKIESAFEISLLGNGSVKIPLTSLTKTLRNNVMNQRARNLRKS